MYIRTYTYTVTNVYDDVTYVYDDVTNTSTRTTILTILSFSDQCV